MKKYTTLTIVSIFTLVIGLAFVFLPKEQVRATSTDSVYGYAWSDNVGWIRFNDCPTPGDTVGCASSNGYGVSIDETSGDFSGYAWSSAIGWINFNLNSGCPQGSCKAQLQQNGEVTGWAYAPSVSNNGGDGGWTGWISFNCSNTSSCGTSNYKTSLAAPSAGIRDFSGYAWGSEVVGWIDMSGVVYYEQPAPLADVTITANPQYVAVGGSTSLSWTSSNAVSCEVESADAVSGWSAGSRNTSGSNYSVSNINSNTTYFISCYNVDNIKVRKGVLVVIGNPDYTLQSPSPGTISAVNGSGAGCPSQVRTFTRSVPHSQFGWIHQVTFSASSSTLSGVDYNFYTTPSGGSPTNGSITRAAGLPVWLEVDSALPLPSGSHTVTITGISNGVSRTTNVTICGDGSGGKPKPIFIEF